MTHLPDLDAFPRYTFSDIINYKANPVDSIAGSGWIKRGGCTLLSGPTGVGKTVLADHQAADLEDWLKKFNETVDELVGLFSTRDSLLDLQGYSLVKKPEKTPPPCSPPAQSGSDEQDQTGGEHD